jgi:hypothetical protein
MSHSVFLGLPTCPRKGAPLFSFLHFEVHALGFVFHAPTLVFLILPFCLLILLFLGLLPFIHLSVWVLVCHFFETGWESCVKPVKDDVSVVHQEVDEGIVGILSLFHVGAIIQEKLEAGAHSPKDLGWKGIIECQESLVRDDVYLDECSPCQKEL